MTDADLSYHRIEEARIVLESLGMDAERSNERSALVLLALLDLSPEPPWHTARNPMLGTRSIMDFIRDSYGRNYAPNTRETIRRFTLHQFVQSGLVEENADDPSRPVNSPRWNYRVTSSALSTIRTFNSPDWERRLDQYLEDSTQLVAAYAAERDMLRVPVRLSEGRTLSLSPGGQNLLIQATVNEFCPRFTPGAEILYVGDAASKWAHADKDRLSALGIALDEHGKMPDLVVYLRSRNWLVLLEAASTHGPIDHTRKTELSQLFSESTAGLVYVSCFPDRTTFRRYVSDIAWETEVWCADNPSHMIHFDGERFLGPYA